MPSRVRGLASGALEYIISSSPNASDIPTIESFLENIKYVRLYDHFDQIASFNMIEEWIKDNENVRYFIFAFNSPANNCIFVD